MRSVLSLMTPAESSSQDCLKEQLKTTCVRKKDCSWNWIASISLYICVYQLGRNVIVKKVSFVCVLMLCLIGNNNNNKSTVYKWIWLFDERTVYKWIWLFNENTVYKWIWLFYERTVYKWIWLFYESTVYKWIWLFYESTVYKWIWLFVTHVVAISLNCKCPTEPLWHVCMVPGYIKHLKMSWVGSY